LHKLAQWQTALCELVIKGDDNLVNLAVVFGAVLTTLDLNRCEKLAALPEALFANCTALVDLTITTQAYVYEVLTPEDEAAEEQAAKEEDAAAEEETKEETGPNTVGITLSAASALTDTRKGVGRVNLVCVATERSLLTTSTLLQQVKNKHLLGKPSAE
jgi:hypothetical protein